MDIFRGRTVNIFVEGCRTEGRAKRRFMDTVKEDMTSVGVREEDAEY